LKSLSLDARSLLAPTPEAFAHASARFPKALLRLVPIEISPLTLSMLAPERPKCLAVIPAAASASAYLSIRALLDELAFRERRYSVVVAGETFDDMTIMSRPSAFVTGSIESKDDLAAVLAPHNVVALLVGFDRPLFGHPIIEATREASLPVAFVDWSKSMDPRDKDLAIPTAMDVRAMAKLVANWLEKF
jgi:hypothetical protein